MLKHITLLLLISISIFSCKPELKQRTQLSINDNWQFKALDSSIWHSAKVPGLVHLDLYENQLIPNPFDSTNEEQLQWIGKKTWEYKCVFNAFEVKKYQNINLTFEGLDTYAEVYLNDSLILNANNMYRKWSAAVKSLLRKKNNKLRIVFKNSEAIIDTKAKQSSYLLPDSRGFIRKAPYHFGWDWGAKFVTAGIWKKVYLDFWNSSKINNVNIIQNNVDSVNANFTAWIKIESDSEDEYSVDIYNVANGKLLANKQIQLQKAKSNYLVDFDISEPKLWWCNGMGKANVYKIGVRVIKNNYIIDNLHQNIGIRTIELVQEDDSIGKSFYFKLNGKAVFIKGANYVPADNFLPRIDKYKYEKLIDNAVWANFNMLRVWGGGIYESDEFYDLCDEKGIMVWQDFMFACNMHPGDSAFMNSVKHEAIDNIIRLRNHPSLALWCGNNEVDNGWKDWGWQKQLGYSKSDSTEIWENYLKVFEKMLPELVNKYDGQRNYHPSSPTYGWGHEENLTHGDSHYWGVWWGHEPFEVFDTKVGRFMSEYGFQALPNIKSINEFANKEEQSLSSKTMATHQKHPTGYQTIDEYLKRNYKSADNFEDYIYLSQLTQAEGITTAIEAHRRNKPHCMGTLYWQFNDAWPVTSWSSVDYYGRKKALHYFVKKAYEPIIISCIEQGDNILVYVISDKEEEEEINVEVNHLDFNGVSIYMTFTRLSIDNKQSYTAIKIPKPSERISKESFLYVQIKGEEKYINNYFYYFEKPKDMNLPIASINVSIDKNNGVFVINLESDVLAKNVEVSTNLEGEISDNYFDILPNTPRKIIFKPSQEGSLKVDVKILNNIYK